MTHRQIDASTAPHRNRKRSHQRVASLALFGVLAAACGSATDDGASPIAADASATDSADPAGDVDAADSNTDATAGSAAGNVTVPANVEPSAPDVTFSGLTIAQTGINEDGAPEPLAELSEIISGGPPPDGIPPIDDPKFVTTDQVDYLGEREPVLAVDINGDRRAYPVQVLIWHEIVNDTVGGVPVSVTYCPLCNSAVAVDRRLDDKVLDFGTSGMLWNSALVMYDRQTETLWSHFTGQGIVGELTGVELDRFPVATVPWGVWRDANPDGIVLDRDTGFSRNYGSNPYVGYDNVDSDPFLFQGEVDGRYTAMTRMVGFETGDDAIGVPLISLQAQPTVMVDAGGQDLVVWWEPGTNSSLDTSSVADGADIGSTGVFVAAADRQALTFSAISGDQPGAGFIDAETGSTWNVLGEATDGPLAGTQLEAIPHVDTFWFAWSTFRSDTRVVDS